MDYGGLTSRSRFREGLTPESPRRPTSPSSTRRGEDPARDLAPRPSRSGSSIPNSGCRSSFLKPRRSLTVPPVARSRRSPRPNSVCPPAIASRPAAPSRKNRLPRHFQLPLPAYTHAFFLHRDSPSSRPPGRRSSSSRSESPEASPHQRQNQPDRRIQTSKDEVIRPFACNRSAFGWKRQSICDPRPVASGSYESSLNDPNRRKAQNRHEMTSQAPAPAWQRNEREVSPVRASVRGPIGRDIHVGHHYVFADEQSEPRHCPPDQSLSGCQATTSTAIPQCGATQG
jgi:hypothetical protein